MAAKSTSRCLSFADLATKLSQINSKASIREGCCPRMSSQMDIRSMTELGSQRKLIVSFLDISCLENVPLVCMHGRLAPCMRQASCMLSSSFKCVHAPLSKSLLWESKIRTVLGTRAPCMPGDVLAGLCGTPCMDHPMHRVDPGAGHLSRHNRYTPWLGRS